MFIVQTSVAQDNRLLFHYSRYKDVIYDVGDVISFREKGSKQKVTWQITEITDTTIVSGKEAISPFRIGAIYSDRRIRSMLPFRDKVSYILIGAGVVMITLDVLNSKEFDRQVATTAAVMIGGGVLAKTLIKNCIRLKPGRKLVILR
jgi:hypothetical protein